MAEHVFRVFFALMLTVSTSLADQRRQVGSPSLPAKVSATIAMKIGSTQYDFRGQAVCEHLARGSIYDTPAERWSVQQDEAGRSLHLTLWRPLAGGGDMLTFSISMGGKEHDVDTVRSPRNKQVGSANVKFVREGNGGTFTLDATAGSGAKLSGTIKCDSFTASTPVAG